MKRLTEEHLGDSLQTNFQTDNNDGDNCLSVYLYGLYYCYEPTDGNNQTSPSKYLATMLTTTDSHVNYHYH